MKIALFAPYGVLSQESGLIYLLGNYVRRTFPDVVQLRCNGVFSVCDRDAERGWRRSMSSCFGCIAEQREFARWSGVGAVELSRCLTRADIEETKRWIMALPAEQLAGASFDGADIFALCLGSWQNRYDVSRPDMHNAQHEQTLRRFMLSAARAYRAAGRFFRESAPDMTFIAGGSDFMSRAFAAQARSAGRDAAVCAWDVSKRAVMVGHPRGHAALPCGLLLDGLIDMRADPTSWSPDLTAILDELLTFVGIREEPRAAAGAR